MVWPLSLRSAPRAAGRDDLQQGSLGRRLVGPSFHVSARVPRQAEATAGGGDTLVSSARMRAQTGHDQGKSVCGACSRRRHADMGPSKKHQQLRLRRPATMQRNSPVARLAASPDMGLCAPGPNPEPVHARPSPRPVLHAYLSDCTVGSSTGLGWGCTLLCLRYKVAAKEDVTPDINTYLPTTPHHSPPTSSPKPQPSTLKPSSHVPASPSSNPSIHIRSATAIYPAPHKRPNQPPIRPHLNSHLPHHEAQQVPPNHCQTRQASNAHCLYRTTMQTKPGSQAFLHEHVRARTHAPIPTHLPRPASLETKQTLVYVSTQ